MNRQLLIMLACGVALCGCKPTTPAPTPADAKAPQSPSPPVPSDAQPAEISTQYQPEYTLAITASAAEPPTYTVSWTALVNSGGWSMTTDDVLVEESMGKIVARVYVTLEQPAASDMVTQALETLRGSHDAGATKVDEIELSVRREQRGVDSPWPALYSIVKRTND